MLKISDLLIKDLINIMKSHVDFNQNTKNFLSNLINKKLDITNTDSKKYIEFLQKESLIYDLKYGIKKPDFSFVDLFRINDVYENKDYRFSFYNYQKDQVLMTNEAPPLQDLKQGKNIVVLDRNIIVPCIVYKDKPFCILPIKDIIKQKKYNKLKGNVLVYGLGLGNLIYALSQNENIEEIDIIEDNAGIKDIFSNFILPKFNTNKNIKIIDDKDKEYDYIIIDDTYLSKDNINSLYEKYCYNKNVFFTNIKTIENNFKLELFKQIIVFIGDPQNINKDSKIGEKLFYYLSEKDFELNTVQEFFIFIDEIFKDVLHYKIKK